MGETVRTITELVEQLDRRFVESPWPWTTVSLAVFSALTWSGLEISTPRMAGKSRPE